MPFSIVRNDIARVRADVLVNAANERLLPGGGVCGALFAAAGFEAMDRACREIGYCPTGGAVTTPGFDLPCRWVVHAVGPVWRGGGAGEQTALRRCYRSVFAEVERLGAASVAFPLISAGIYGYPTADALRVAREEAAAFLERTADVLVTLVVFTREVLMASGGIDAELRSYIDDAYVERSPFMRGRRGSSEMSCGVPSAAAAPALDDAPPTGADPLSGLSEALENLDAPFSPTLLSLIDARGLTDAEVYKRANISRQLFAKIRANPGYRPKKPTAVALGIALRLDMGELSDLLARAGFTLSRSSRFDVIVGYFVSRGCYDIFLINEALFAYDQPLLGSQ